MPRTNRLGLVGLLALVSSLSASCGSAVSNTTPDLGPGAGDGGLQLPEMGRLRGDGGGCPSGVVCSADHMTVRQCTVDGTPGPTVVDTCDPTAGETCIFDHCVNACDSSITELSNEGCEFWPIHLWTTADDAGTSGPLGVIASNTSTTVPAVVTLEDATGVIATMSVAPLSAQTFMVDTARDRLSRTMRGQALHLRSNQPIAAYELNPVDSASTLTGSASLLLPTHTLGTHYRVLSYTYNACVSTNPPQGQGYLAVIGTQPNSSVKITVPVATMASADGKIPALAAGATTSVTLGEGEAVEITEANSLDDITGAEILADKPVVGIGGSGTTTVPDTAPGGDHFEVQLFPTTTWGKNFECEKYQKRAKNDVDYWRIIAALDGTTVTLSDPTIATIPSLAAGAMYELSTAANFEMASNQPILVGHYIEAWGALSGKYDPTVFPDPTTNTCPFAGTGNDAECLGDANMTLAVPKEQYRTSYVFFTPTTYAYDYVDVIAPIAGANILLDGKAIPALTPFASGAFGLAQVRLSAGVHAITGAMPFGINSYGYDYAISYSYPGGLDLKTIGIP